MNDDVAGLAERLEDRANRMVELGSPRGELLTEAASTIRALAAEVERLRDLFRVDGEQHATRIREMEKAHDARIAKYYGALEAERAKLSEAVGVMQAIEENEDQFSMQWAAEQIRAFLATMEKPRD